MDVDESNMKEWKEPSLWQKLRNAVVALLFGAFLVFVTPLIFPIFYFNHVIIYFLLILYGFICLVLGWFYGDDFINYLHAKIENWWDHRNMFR